MQTKVVVLGVERSTRFEKGEVIDCLWCHYFDPHLSNSRLFMGFTITKIDIQGRLSLSDFSELPAICALEYSIVKSQPLLKSVSVLKPFSVEDCEDLLVLSVRPGEFTTEDKSLKKGLNIHYIDCSSHQDNSDTLGFLPSRAWLDKLPITSFPQVPAYYRFSGISHAKDKRGNALIKLSGPSLVRPYSLDSSVPQAS